MSESGFCRSAGSAGPHAVSCRHSILGFWGLIYFLALNERGRARALLRSSAELGFSLNLTPEVSKALVAQYL